MVTFGGHARLQKTSNNSSDIEVAFKQVIEEAENKVLKNSHQNQNKINQQE